MYVADSAWVANLSFALQEICQQRAVAILGRDARAFRHQIVQQAHHEEAEDQEEELQRLALQLVEHSLQACFESVPPISFCNIVLVAPRVQSLL